MSRDYLERQNRADDPRAGDRNAADGFVCVGWRPHSMFEVSDHPGFEIWQKPLPEVVTPPSFRWRFTDPDYLRSQAA